MRDLAGNAVDAAVFAGADYADARARVTQARVAGESPGAADEDADADALALRVGNRLDLPVSRRDRLCAPRRARPA